MCSCCHPRQAHELGSGRELAGAQKNLRLLPVLESGRAGRLRGRHIIPKEARQGSVSSKSASHHGVNRPCSRPHAGRLAATIRLANCYFEIEVAARKAPLFSSSPILPRWLSNQCFADSFFPRVNFHLWKCSARGAKTSGLYANNRGQLAPELIKNRVP